MSWTSRRIFKQAIKWLAAEHKYFKELQEDLEQLKQDAQTAKEKESLGDVRHAFRDFRYLAKSERRFERKFKDIEDILKELKQKTRLAGSAKTAKIAENLQREAEAAANYLVKAASYFEGSIRERLLSLQHEVKGHQWAQIKITLQEVEEIAAQAQKWIAALQIDIEKARKLEEEYVHKHGGLSEKEWEEFLTKNPESNIEVIAEKFFYDKSLPMKSKKILLKLFFREVEKVLEAGNHLRVEYILDKYKLPLPRAWKLLGDYFMQQAHEHPKSGRDYCQKAAAAYKKMGKEGAALVKHALQLAAYGGPSLPER